MSESVSYWSADLPIQALPSLESNLEDEVVVIGAGISGLTTAYLLLKEGKSVTIVTEGPLAGRETCRTTAHITYMLDERFFVLEKLFGTEGLRKILTSHKEAIDQIETICQEETIDCDFERVESHLFNAPEMPDNILELEYQALQRAGFHNARLEKSPFPFFESQQVLSLPNQAQFHPLKYIQGLYLTILRLGGKIFTDAHVIEITGGDRCKARTDKSFDISAKCMVVATNSPFNNRFVMHTKQAAYRTYVIGAYVPKGTIPKGLYSDTLDPYHYVRVVSEAQKDVLIIGGEDHKTGQKDNPQSCYEKLIQWSKERFPMINTIAFHWSGQVLEPVDGIGFIGKNPLEKNVFIITGASGSGMTYGTLGGMIICDLIQEKPSPYANLYDPSRKTIKATTEFAKENLNVGAQYVDWVAPPESTDLQDIPKNSGKLFQSNLNKIAVYRDEKGDLFEFSAVCPHLGCIVNWNDAEKTWDCPCHGSRFGCKGKVLTGPAVSDLKKCEAVLFDNKPR